MELLSLSGAPLAWPTSLSIAQEKTNCAGEDDAVARVVAKQIEVFDLTAEIRPHAEMRTPQGHVLESARDLKSFVEDNDANPRASAILTLWSPHSAAGDSKLTSPTLAVAHHGDFEKKLLNAKIAPCRLPASLSNQSAIDISEWVKDRSPMQFEQLRLHLLDLIDDVKYREAVAEENKPEIYLAYARPDLPHAQRLSRELETLGYRLWWDQQINPGESWQRTIRDNFEDAKCVVLLMSHSAATSRWIMLYIHHALRRGVLVPGYLEGFGGIPQELAQIQGADLSRWRQTHDATDPNFQRLLSAIKHIAGPPRERIEIPKPRRRIQEKVPEKPRDGHDVFVSYTREDRPKIRPFVDRLRNEKLSVWWDELIPEGANWGFHIENALKISRSVVVFWTPLSVESEEVYAEADYGKSIQALFPVRLERCDVPIRMRAVQYIDLTEPDQSPIPPFERLLTSLKVRIGLA